MELWNHADLGQFTGPNVMFLKCILFLRFFQDILICVMHMDIYSIVHFVNVKFTLRTGYFCTRIYSRMQAYW